ncbi:MAG: helix-turn-helix domain-containing protein [Ruminococcus sp.]|nr:helix-turn-helix domain-containing protein [Ruminococcus sp.]
MKDKQAIISQIVILLSQLSETEDEKPTAAVSTEDKPVEMLTVKECTEVVKGLSEHTVRQLVAQEKIPYIRTGQGKRGKILISKDALIAYFNKSA